LDNPMRGNPALRLGRRTGYAEQVGAKVRRVTLAGTKVYASGPVEGPRGPVLGGQSAATRSKVTEGSGERPGSRAIDRIFPAQAEPAGCGGMARTMFPARKRSIGTGERCFGSGPQRRREERRSRGNALLPLKTR